MTNYVLQYKYNCITIKITKSLGGQMMDEPVFVVCQKKYTGETAVISMRIPKTMLADIDRAAEISGRTRNEIMSLSLEFALNHMKITSPDKE